MKGWKEIHTEEANRKSKHKEQGVVGSDLENVERGHKSKCEIKYANELQWKNPSRVPSEWGERNVVLFGGNGVKIYIDGNP